MLQQSNKTGVDIKTKITDHTMVKTELSRFLKHVKQKSLRFIFFYISKPN